LRSFLLLLLQLWQLFLWSPFVIVVAVVAVIDTVVCVAIAVIVASFSWLWSCYNQLAEGNSNQQQHKLGSNGRGGCGRPWQQASVIVTLQYINYFKIYNQPAEGDSTSISTNTSVQSVAAATDDCYSQQHSVSSGNNSNSCSYCCCYAASGTVRYEVHYPLQQSGNGRQKKCFSQ